MRRPSGSPPRSPAPGSRPRGAPAGASAGTDPASKPCLVRQQPSPPRLRGRGAAVGSSRSQRGRARRGGGRAPPAASVRPTDRRPGDGRCAEPDRVERLAGASPARRERPPEGEVLGDRERGLQRVAMADIVEARRPGRSPPSADPRPPIRPEQPARIRNSVDLPAPFGPVTISASPGARRNESLEEQAACRRGTLRFSRRSSARARRASPRRCKPQNASRRLAGASRNFYCRKRSAAPRGKVQTDPRALGGRTGPRACSVPPWPMPCFVPIRPTAEIRRDQRSTASMPPDPHGRRQAEYDYFSSPRPRRTGCPASRSCPSR